MGGIEQVGNSSLFESLKIETKKNETTKAVETEPVRKVATLSLDRLASAKVVKGIPQVENNVAKNFNKDNHTFEVGTNKFTNVKQITEGVKIDEAEKITQDNKIDEIFLETEDGKLYVAYGEKENKGALNLDGVREGYIGKLDGKPAKIVKINNEINTMKEGALSPIKSTWGTVKEAGSSGIVKGIGEMGTTVVAIFVGKSMIQNGITAVQGVNQATTVANGAVKGIDLIKNGTKVVGKVGNTGKAILGTIGSGISQVAVGAVVAGAVVGTIVGGMAIYGAVASRKPKNDYTTLDMVTNSDLKFVPVQKPKEQATATTEKK